MYGEHIDIAGQKIEDSVFVSASKKGNPGKLMMCVSF